MPKRKRVRQSITQRKIKIGELEIKSPDQGLSPAKKRKLQKDLDEMARWPLKSVDDLLSPESREELRKALKKMAEHRQRVLVESRNIPLS